MEIQWKDLIERAKNNDQGAFSALYEHSYDAVYRTVKSMVKDEDTAMDIVQDAFVSGFAHLDGFQPPENFIPWMRRIATNKARDWFRKKHDVTFSQLADEDGNLPEFKDENPDHAPEAVLDRSETTRLIEEILGTLSEEQRIAIGMYYYEEMSVAEIAETLGVSENTVKSRLNYGRKKIKAGVEELEKKGTKLYSLAPVSFLIWLLRCQKALPAAGKAPVWLLENILAQGATQAAAGAAGGAAAAGAAATASSTGTAAAAGAAAAATKTGLLSTLGAKIAAGVLATVLVGGGVAAGVSFANRGDSTTSADNTQTLAPESTETTTPTTDPETTDPGTTPGVDQSTSADNTQTLEPGTYSEGLEFEQSGLGSSYIVVGIGTCEDTELIIPSMHEGLPVTKIGTSAFYNCDSLTSVTIPEGVTFIDGGAFSMCRSLTSVTIPEGVTSIGDNAFCMCDSLTSVTIPEGVISIGENAFSMCDSLTSVTIPEGVSSIGGGAFSMCYSLTSVAIPESVADIGRGAFFYCKSLTSITIPESVTSILYQTFMNCESMTSITLPGSLRYIAERAFIGCKSLTSIQFGGTMADWEAIPKGASWNERTGNYTVICSDGTVQ